MRIFRTIARGIIVAALMVSASMPAMAVEDDADGAPIPTITLKTKLVKYNLGPGGISLPIKLPANKPIQIVGVNLTLGVRGVGHASLLRIPGSFIEWVGLDSTSGAAITEGFSGSPGTKILFIDFAHQVIVEVASPDSIQIHNASGGTRTGKLIITY